MTSLTTALPLYNGIDNQVCFSIIDYLTNHNVWTSQVFGSAQYAYIKDDLASKQRAAVFCFPIFSSKNSFGYTQRGKIVLELHFSLQKQRVDLAQNVIQIANLIQLINLNQQFTQYAQTQMYGLFWIGKECHADYSQVYAKESKVKIELDYSVDLLAYQTGLQSAGFDIISPDEQIYNAVTALLEKNVLLDQNQQPVIIT